MRKNIDQWNKIVNSSVLTFLWSFLLLSSLPLPALLPFFLSSFLPKQSDRVTGRETQRDLPPAIPKPRARHGVPGTQTLDKSSATSMAGMKMEVGFDPRYSDIGCGRFKYWLNLQCPPPDSTFLTKDGKKTFPGNKFSWSIMIEIVFPPNDSGITGRPHTPKKKKKHLKS